MNDIRDAPMAEELSNRQTDLERAGQDHFLDQAERIHYAAISRRWTKPECTIAAKWLQSACPDAAEYLAWLLTHRMGKWPGVKGNGFKKASREDVVVQTTEQ